MIDKNFYLENLSAFDILIQDEREKAEAVIFRVFSMLQRDKIWLREVASDEEIFEEDAELLDEIEAELKELDLKYGFKFDAFYELVQQELKKRQSLSSNNLESSKELHENNNSSEDEHFTEEDDLDYDDLDDEEDFYDEDGNELSHLSDEELDLVTDYILESAKTRFDFAAFVEDFPIEEDGFVEEEFLLPLIAAKAFGESDAEIAAKMVSSLSDYGYEIEMEDIINLISQKAKELGPEILAFKIAADSLQQGANPLAVIQQISQLLRS